ncbi:MAG: Ig-like domain-containing protein, partial [Cyanobacteria bacterium J06648_11]
MAVASAIATILALGVLALGDRIPPSVRSANWEGKTLGTRDRVLVLTFSRLMDEDSVEANLTFDPPAPGRANWSGRSLVYTLEQPLQYGQTYSLSLADARDRQGRPLAQPYELELATRDRQFLAIGTEGRGEGQLVHVNLTT